MVLCSARDAVGETRFNLVEKAQRHQLTSLLSSLGLFDAADPSLPRAISLPDTDKPILLAALEAQATHLIAGDVRYFGPLLGKKIEGIIVLLPPTYLKKHLGD